ncbi:MAG: hypothetical protein IPP48_04995 [Chitinophagaceae bacterium]|nr:hypothetical protein [Chitinophagaceae bacterium]
MKKFLLLATAALLVTGVTFADNGKKKKKCAKGKTCCSKDAAAKKSCSKDETATGTKKSCCKDKHNAATAQM